MKRNLEELEQKKAVEYLEILKRQGKIISFFAPMNENVMSGSDRQKAIIIENKSKAMGKRKGVSDLVIILKDKVLFVELKRAGKRLKSGKISYTGIKVSENQKRFLDEVNQSNVCEGFVAFGFDEFKNKIDDILKERK